MPSISTFAIFVFGVVCGALGIPMAAALMYSWAKK